MKDFFSQDKAGVGLLAGLGSELGFALVLAVVLLAVGQSPADHLRWFGGAFIPPILLLRHYAKGQGHLHVVKALIVVLFATFLAFMFLLFKLRIIVLQ